MNFEIKLPDGDIARIEDASMRAGTKRVRRVSTLETWRNKGAITKQEFNSADMFQRDYAKARLLPKYSASSIGVEGGFGFSDGDEWKHDRSRRAYDSVNAALLAVGKRAAPVLVAVVGEGQSIRSYAGGGGIQQAQARSTLLSALHALTVHYGLHNA